MAEPRFRVLGPLEASGSQGPLDLGGRRQQMVLALLLAAPNLVVSTERLIEEVWGDQSPYRARHSLQTYVSNLRRLLRDADGQPIVSQGPGYLLRVRSYELDSLKFIELVDTGGRLVSDRPREAVSMLREALGLWRGSPFDGLVDEVAALRDEAGRLEELRLVAVEQRITGELQLRNQGRLVSELQSLTLQYPLRERFWGLLMIALYRSGRQAEALRTYQDARRVLGEELGIEPSPELRALEERVLLQDPELAAPSDSIPPPTNLPTPLSSFIGRTREVAELRATLAHSRLLTVTGPPGIGKTRLAIQVASELAEKWQDGVFLIDLSALGDKAHVATEMLGILGLDAPFHQTRLDALCNQLKRRSLLVVLDNCEHLAHEVARVVVAVLYAAPNVRVLATSRVSLGATGEVVWPLGPLTLPSGESASHVLESEAGRLFSDRASVTHPAFKVTEENAPAVAEICWRLDGLPLAIELAAIRVRSLAVSEIEQRLDDRFRLLTHGDPTAAPRQQTLSATIQWSYDLLDEPQQALYRQLAVFPSGFTLQAAEAVCTARLTPRPAVADVLHDLIVRSLVAANAGPFATRYRMLESIRAYGLERLRDAREEESAHTNLLQWALVTAEEAQRQMAGPESMTYVRSLLVEYDNIRAALAWAVDRDPVTGLKLVIPLARFYWLHPSAVDRQRLLKWPSYLQEGAGWFQRMLAAAGDVAPARLRVLALAHLAGRLELRQGRLREADQHLQQAEALLQDLDDADAAGWVAYYTAWVTWGRVPIGQTVGLIRRALDLNIRAGDDLRIIGSTLFLGYALLLEGKQNDEAIRLLRKAHQAAQHAAIPDLVGHTADFMALAGVLHDTGEDIRQLLAQSLKIFSEGGFQPCLAHVLQTAALWQGKAGDVDRAAELLGAAQGIRDRLSIVTPALEDRTLLVLDSCREFLGHSAWVAAFARGRGLEFDQAADLAFAGLGRPVTDRSSQQL